MELELWLINNLIDYEFILDKTLLIVSDKVFQVILSKEIEGEQKIFDEDFKLILDSNDINIIDEYKSDYFLFLFGGQWYYYQTNKSDPELNLFKYFGKAKQEIEIDYAFLGVHTGYELCNGSRLAEDWIKKAKFLGIKQLGICELNTLGGTLKFQDQCKKAEIQPIIGETVVVNDGKERYELKLFVENEKGWQNLLNINSQINVFTDGFVSEQFLLEHAEGLICVISCSKNLEDEFLNSIDGAFKNYFYQIDLVQYSSNEKDREHLSKIQYYLQTYFKDGLRPILLFDAYYLDQEDYEIKSLLNKIGKVGFKYQSKDQHFKSLDEINLQFVQLHPDKHNGQQALELFESCLSNTLLLADSCKFQIKKNEMHLPKYEMTEEEKKQFKTNDELFNHLIAKGFEERIIGKVENEDQYFERFETEIAVIIKGGFVDYFLILWDILNWCKNNNILTGTGRGSSAGALTSYLLYITHLDPIRYKLLFERFLNEARISSLPDIDVDFESEHRDKVKKYMQDRYTFNNVACIGTFNMFKLKSCIKDVGRELNLDHSTTNFISSLVDKEFEDGKFIDLFKCSLKEPKLKEFIDNHHQLIKYIQLILFQPKVKSIHAAAVVITPKYEDRSTIYDLLPVRVEDGILVIEYDKLDVDATGFLKEDILGLHQLDKIHAMIKLINKNYNKDIDLFNIDVCDEKVYDYFKKGLTEDVFQFNTTVQKKYMIDLQPDTIEELTTANALNRPGPMESGSHVHYVEMKNGKREVEYDHLLEDVTKDTLGLYAFQEQVMMAYKIVTDCTLTESDSFRKLTSKIWEGQQSDDKIIRAKTLFIDSYIKKGVSEEYATIVWDKLIAFSGYGFNIAHSASYAVLGYYSLWFKVYYPLEFWVSSLQFSKEEQIVAKLAEINQAGVVQVIAPDINKSDIQFTCDKDTNKIYWSITSIKFCGEVAVNDILEQRKIGGKFKSLQDFITRVKKANKRVIHYLILAGCFDEIENIKSARDRFFLIKKYFNDILQDECPAEYSHQNVLKDHYWQVLSKEVCGYGYINYQPIINAIKTKYKYVDIKDLVELDQAPDHDVMIAGYINIIEEKSSKRGKYAKIILDNNNVQLSINIWNETYSKYVDKLKEKSLIALNGSAKMPDKYNSNITLQSNNQTVIHFI